MGLNPAVIYFNPAINLFFIIFTWFCKLCLQFVQFLSFINLSHEGFIVGTINIYNLLIPELYSKWKKKLLQTHLSTRPNQQFDFFLNVILPIKDVFGLVQNSSA